jgi:hypothetical protein
MAKKPQKRTLGDDVWRDWCLWYRPPNNPLQDAGLGPTREAEADLALVLSEMTRRFEGFAFEWHPWGDDPRSSHEKLADMRRTRSPAEELLAALSNKPDPVRDAARGLLREIGLMREAGFEGIDRKRLLAEIETKILQAGWGPAVTDDSRQATTFGEWNPPDDAEIDLLEAIPAGSLERDAKTVKWLLDPKGGKVAMGEDRAGSIVREVFEPRGFVKRPGGKRWGWVRTSKGTQALRQLGRIDPGSTRD